MANFRFGSPSSYRLLSFALIDRIAGQDMFELYWLLDGLRNEPLSSDYWWLYVMCFSTLLPTLVHFLIAGLAAVLWLPQKARLWIADEVAQHNRVAERLALAYFSLMPVFALLMPAALLYGGYWLLSTHGATIGLGLLDELYSLAAMIDPFLPTAPRCD